MGATKEDAMRITENFRRWRRYRTMVRELRGYSHHELTELGIATADIDRIAAGAVYGMNAFGPSR